MMSELKGKTLLISSGGCEEPVDGVRCLSNFSSGNTGTLIAEEALKRGASVILLAARRAVVPALQEGLTINRFTSYSDLKKLLFESLKSNPDGLIMAAAVSDFSVEKMAVNGQTYLPGEGKLSSDDAPVLYLKKNKKLVDEAKRLYPSLTTVAFKLTNTRDEEKREAAVKKLLKSSRAEYVVANDLHEIDESKHRFLLISSEGNVTEGDNKHELARAVLNVWGGVS